MKQIAGPEASVADVGRPLPRGRGLKPHVKGKWAQGKESPPPTGAWIETPSGDRVIPELLVSPPPTGAWIETPSIWRGRTAPRVAPSHGGVD
uniref:Uncharacterized protein n=1 Tax=Magnetococcus massalia (strain MO-1) TaxID=451514 RepID=A0A1S7LGN3_MAGMO|nr:conserved protein of unknown function [Candidatus Magnetococcus massalia]